MLNLHVSVRMLTLLTVLVSFLIVSGYYLFQMTRLPATRTTSSITSIPLPEASTEGAVSVEEAISRRRSIREYSKEPITLEELSQLLWSAQGITDPNRKLRAAPSAGATYPIEVYVVIGDGCVEGLQSGVYHYVPEKHRIDLLFRGDLRSELSAASLSQEWIAEAPIDIVITAVYERTVARYGDRGTRYVHMEAGHVAENIYLEATALSLGTVTVGAFNDEEVQRVLGLPDDHEPLCIMPVGHI